MYPEARLQFTLVTKDSYNKEMQSCVECARNITSYIFIVNRFYISFSSYRISITLSNINYIYLYIY